MENSNDILSPNDPDLLLAQKIGDALPAIESLKGGSDPLLQQLFSYRETRAEQLSDVDSSSIWDAIESEMQTRKPATIFQLTPAIRRYATAAAVLIAALVGSFLYQNLSGPKLIGESFSTVTKVELSDGSIVSLRPNSKLYEHSISKSEATYSIEGEAYFEVMHDPTRTFAVSTSQAKVEVLGTKFVLSDWGNTSRVFLEEGRIQYESLSNQNVVILEPGQSSEINEFTVTPDVIETESSVYTDWLADQLVFQDQRVEDVFNELEHHFNIQIQRPEVLDEENLTGTIQLDDLPSVLQDLELVLGGSFTQTGENEYRFNPES
ncbi:MAG: FecR domain-containing protein [Gracilimonas sp.]